MERCPNCGASDRGASACHRCGTELEHLRAIEHTARQAVARAWRALEADDPERAVVEAENAVALHRTPLSVRSLAVARLVSGQHEEAITLWREQLGAMTTSA